MFYSFWDCQNWTWIKINNLFSSLHLFSFYCLFFFPGLCDFCPVFFQQFKGFMIFGASGRKSRLKTCSESGSSWRGCADAQEAGSAWRWGRKCFWGGVGVERCEAFSNSVFADDPCSLFLPSLVFSFLSLHFLTYFQTAPCFSPTFLCNSFLSQPFSKLKGANWWPAAWISVETFNLLTACLQKNIECIPKI